MKRFLYFLAVILVILIILANYKVREVAIDPDTLKGTAKAKDAKYLTVDITYDSTIPADDIEDVQAAVMKMPAKVIQDFVDKGWQIFISYDATGHDGSNYTASGVCDFENKTIRIRPVQYQGVTDFVKLKTLHEMSHFADYSTYGRASETDEFMQLYEDMRGVYVEREFSGVKETPENVTDIKYATSEPYEFFACAMKDYVENPAYLQANYPEIYHYFNNLTK